MRDGFYLLSVYSGYKKSNWTDFLDKWLILGKLYRSYYNSLVAGFRERQEKPDFQEAEKRLGVKLPQSYKDFLMVCNPGRGWLKNRQDAGDSYMLPLSEIDFLKNLEKELYEIALTDGFDSSDEDYFKYYPRQQGGSDKGSFYDKLIVVGRNSENDLVILNPYVRTLDGELETTFLSHGSIRRATSFAAMMKNIYLYEVGDFGHYPLYETSYVNAISEIQVGYPYEDYENNKVLKAKWVKEG